MSVNQQYGVEFTLGFEFDGFTAYRNLAMNNSDDKLKKLSRLSVYDDPELLTFKEVRI